MKLFLFASLAAVGATAATAAAVDLDDASVGIRDRFLAFKAQFGKTYAAGEEEQRAFRAFSQNDAIVQSHNARDLSFTLGHNEFSDMTQDEFAASMLSRGYNPNDAREKSYDLSLSDPARVAAAPAAVDWTTLHAVTPIKNQGQCGSCWAFSTVMALEGALAVEKKVLTSLSEQDLVSCDHNGDQGCNGGLMDNAFKWVEENGICTEEAYPYASGTGTTGTCETKCTPYMTISNFTDVTPHDEDALKVAVAQQPVSVAIEADKSIFQLYKSGVLKSEFCGTQLDHGVGIVGYGTEDGTEYWKVKNSWGASWGMEGYILMERGTNVCGISQQPSYPNGAHLHREAESEATAAATTSNAERTKVRHVTTVAAAAGGAVADPDPPQPAQPADFVIFVTNFCNSTATLSKDNYNLWEGQFVTDPPDTVASQMSSRFKYGFEVQADPATARINGTVMYETPFVYIDFFSVPGEWGIEVEAQPSVADVIITQADVGNLSVYNLILGYNQTC